jgi:hypothetical protein
MRLWTIQPPVRLEQLAEVGVIHGSWKHVERDERARWDFYDAYRWMVQQMAARMPRHSGNPPIWAWPVKPDLRHYRWSWMPEGWYTCIEFDAPDERVLLSEFDLWHDVLNCSICSLTEAEFDSFHDRFDADPRPRAEKEDAFCVEMMDTWQRIFDPDVGGDPEWRGTGDLEWQACVDGLLEEWVRDVRIFRSRKTKNHW